MQPQLACRASCLAGNLYRAEHCSPPQWHPKPTSETQNLQAAPRITRSVGCNGRPPGWLIKLPIWPRCALNPWQYACDFAGVGSASGTPEGRLPPWVVG